MTENRNPYEVGEAKVFFIIPVILFLAALGATAFLRVQDVAGLDREGRELQITSRREEEDEEENITVADLDEETLRWIYAANAMVYDEAFDPFFIGGLDPEKEGNVRRMQRELESAWGWKNYDPDMTTASFEELYEAGVYLRASRCREEWAPAGIDFPSFQETRLTDAVRE